MTALWDIMGDIILGLDAENVTKIRIGGPSAFVAHIANLVSSTCL